MFPNLSSKDSNSDNNSLIYTAKSSDITTVVEVRKVSIFFTHKKTVVRKTG